MNCEQVENSIVGFTDGSLSGILCQAINHHVKRCRRCAMIIQQEQLLVEQLSEIPAPTPSDAFFPKALKKAQDYNDNVRYFDAPFPAISVAACFLLAVFLTVILQIDSLGIYPESNYLTKGVELTVLENEQLNIHLQVSVKNDVDDAMMVIEMPSSLQIVGFEDVSVLEWPVILKKGKNVLELPVKARRQFTEDQISLLVARLKTNTLQKDFAFKVTIKSSFQEKQDAIIFFPRANQSKDYVLDLKHFDIYNISLLYQLV